MTPNLSILELVLNASVLVQLVMLILLLASLVSWMYIFRKAQELRAAQRAADSFEQQFWSGGDLTTMYQEVVSIGTHAVGMENIFGAGFKEFARLRRQKVSDPMDVVEGAQRAMRVSLSREIDQLETHLPYLATVGSTSPYIGLFGTVWGIMNSFRALGNTTQATIAMVAPGIAEALVATAMGLFAAIPAVIAYNRYATSTERLINRYDAFVEEFLTILQRQVHS